MNGMARAFSFCLGVMLVLSACGPGPIPTPTDVQASTAAVTSVPTATATEVPVGKTITVTSVDDADPGSLRQALQDAQPGDIINFDAAVFPPAAPAAIMLRSELDPIMQGYLTIDASQVGVILDGSQAGGEWSSCIVIASEHNTVRGLQCVHFAGPGLQLAPEARFNTIGGDPDLGSGPLGQGNQFSDNSDGIALYGSDNVIAGNRIGTDASGMQPMGNRGPGIFLEEGASRNHIGPRNLIAYNGTTGLGGGVEIRGVQAAGNLITANSIHDNSAPAIFFNPGGAPAAAVPLLFDFDLAAGTATGVTCSDCSVEIFSTAADQGDIFEGQTTADAQGTFTFAKGAPLAGPALTSTASSMNENTSAFSAPTAGAARSLQLQQGNGLPKFLLLTKPSDALEDNQIGGLWSGLWQGSFQEGIDNEIVPLGLKRARISFSEGEYISTGAGNAPIDWSRPELPVPTEAAGYVRDLAAHKITVDYVLIFWDKANHPQGWQVQPRFTTQEEVDRYLEYVRAVVTAFKGQVRYYELWNEPHLRQPLQYIRPDDYIRVAKLAIPLIHEIDPQARVVVAAAVTNEAEGRDYLFEILNSDLMPLADVISWHPFYGDGPGVGRDPGYYAKYPALLKKIMSTAAENGFKGEYIADELTFKDSSCDGCGGEQRTFSAVVGAKYLARVVVLHRGSNVIAGVGGVSTSRRIHYATVQNLDNVLAGARAEPFDVQLQTAATNTQVFTFTRSDGSKLAAVWNDGPAVDDDPGVLSSVTIPGFAGWQATGIDTLNGFEQELTTVGDAGALVINDFLLKDYPVFIQLSQ